MDLRFYARYCNDTALLLDYSLKEHTMWLLDYWRKPIPWKLCYVENECWVPVSVLYPVLVYFCSRIYLRPRRALPFSRFMHFLPIVIFIPR
jgi:hypothetical protein